MFEPSTTMNEEVKEQLILAIFTAEAMGKTGNKKATHITNKLRSLYGGHWSVVAADKDIYETYFKAKSEKLAVFDYDKKRWNAYEHAHSSLVPGSRLVKPKEYVSPSVVFYEGTTMNSEVKEQLLFVIFTAEKSAITGYEKLKYIAIKMESVCGGNWSVHVADSDSLIGCVGKEPASFALFDYEGNMWTVYKNKC